MNIIMYTTEEGITKIEVTFDHDTVWLSIDQMAELFQRDKSVIGKHVRNIFKEGELVKEEVWAKFAYTASGGKVYQVDFYNLDVIISVDYRVKSLRGTQFRIWATSILKEYMKETAVSGTASKLNGMSYQAYGKTGSAEFGNNKGDSHAWFTGYAPAENPEVCVTVIMEGAGSGGDYAVPIARRIFDAYFNEKNASGEPEG